MCCFSQELHAALNEELGDLHEQEVEDIKVTKNIQSTLCTSTSSFGLIYLNVVPLIIMIEFMNGTFPKE